MFLLFWLNLSQRRKFYYLAYNLNLSMKNEKNQLCDSLAEEIPKFQSMPDISVPSDSAQPEQQEHVIVESKQPTPLS
jgi:hypothetical protein